MSISSIGDIIRSSRMGTRIPEELLGLPSRSTQYERTYSMDPISAVSRRSPEAYANSQKTEEVSESTVAKQLAELIGNATGTADVGAFHDVLEKALQEQQKSQSVQQVTSDPQYYKNLMMLSQFSSSLISDNLNTLGTSGASLFGGDGLLS